MKRSTLFFLILCVILATVLRLLPGDYHIIFPYDQARDALYMHELVSTKHIPLLGPISDIPGVHHGALYYYVLAPLYWFGQWDIHVVVWFFAIVSSLTIVPLYVLTKRLFSARAGVIAVVLFVCSFEAVSYARWISNPVLAIPLFPLFLLVLEPFWHKKPGKPLFVGMLLGILIQLELVLGYLLFPVLFIFLNSRQKVQKYMWFGVGIAVGALPIVMSELKFHFQALRGILSFGSSHAARMQVVGVFSNIFNQASMLAKNNMFGVAAPVAFCAFVVLLVLLYRKSNVSFLLTILLSSLLLFVVGKTVTIFFLVGLGVICMMLLAFALDLLAKRQKLLVAVLFCVLLVLQLKLYAQQTRSHRAYVQVQPGVLLSDRIEVLDAVFAHVPKNTPFTVSVFGTPYGVRTAWSYYFWWYREHHDTGMPSWYGFAAKGYVGDELLPHVDHPAGVHVTIYEPDFDVSGSAKVDFTTYQDEHTSIVNQIEVNHHLIQFRIPKSGIK